MKHFVYHNDDYDGNGGIDLKEFDTEGQAISFIEERIKGEPTTREIGNYVLIEGKVKNMSVVETVKRIKVI